MMNGLLLTLILFAGGFSSALADATGDGLPEFMRTWLEAQKRREDTRVDFQITKTMPTLKAPVKSSGRFWNYSDGRFLWETGRPPASVLRYDGVTLESWEAVENNWKKLDPEHRSMRLWMYFLSGNQLTETSLLESFAVTVPAAKRPLSSVILQPKSKREQKQLKQIELKFNTEEQRLVQLMVWQGDGGTQTMDFGRPKRMTASDRAAVPQPARR